MRARRWDSGPVRARPSRAAFPLRRAAPLIRPAAWSARSAATATRLRAPQPDTTVSTAAAASCCWRRLRPALRAAASANACSVADRPPGIAFLPDGQFSIGRSRPEELLRATAVVPDLRRLSELIANLRAVGILCPPADQSRPGAQERFVDDLHFLARRAVRHPDDRRTSAAVHRPARAGRASASARVPRPALRSNTDSSSPRSRTARVPCAVTRLRKSSRTSGMRAVPIRSSVASACWASAPPTPPMMR